MLQRNRDLGIRQGEKKKQMLIKIGDNAKQTMTETIIGIEALGKWNNRIDKQTNVDTYIKLTAPTTWPETDTKTKKNQIIMEAMTWLKEGMACRGIPTPKQIQHMKDRGHTKLGRSLAFFFNGRFLEYSTPDRKMEPRNVSV
jgi:hypothetical protein